MHEGTSVMQGSRKPRIAIMGEFSSGKSTLCNLLLGARPLLEKVTATQLPPVWISFGNAPAYVADLDGLHHPLDLADLASVPLEGTEHVRIFLESDLLRYTDLIDMPGISDPSMSPEVWERMAPLADSVLWCTHATQAWRQSEAGVWNSFPEALRADSLLLVTRFDKIVGDSDRLRVLKRISMETQGMFAGFFPISLTQAIAAGEDEDKWRASGAEAFSEALFALVQKLMDRGLLADRDADETAGTTDASSVHTKIGAHFGGLPPEEEAPAVRVSPRRVSASGDRPAREDRAVPPARSANVIMLADRPGSTGEPSDKALRSALTQSKVP